MPLKEKITADLKELMKTHRQFEVGTLRMVLSAVHNREIEKQGKSGHPELTEEEVVEVLRKEVKKRREAAEIFTKANRGDLAEKEEKELKAIGVYLPKGLSEEELTAIVQEVINSGAKNFGEVMKGSMAKIGGRAPAGEVSEIAKKLLG